MADNVKNVQNGLIEDHDAWQKASDRTKTPPTHPAWFVDDTPTYTMS